MKLRGVAASLALALVGLAGIGAAVARGGDRVVTVRLRSGEQVKGTLRGIADGVYRVESGAGVREIRESEIDGVDFEAPAPPAPKLLSFNVTDADLGDVIAEVASAADVPVVLDPEVHEKVTLASPSETWRAALARAAGAAQADVLTLRDGLLLVHQPPRVTVQFTDPNVRTVLQLIAAYSGKNLVVEPGVHGTTSLQIKSAIWSDALSSVAAAVGAVVERRGDVFVVRTEQNAPWGRRDLELADWPAPLPAGSPAPARVDVSASGAPLGEVAARIARQCRVGIEVPAALASRPVTLSVRHASWRDVLALLARTGDFRIREDAALGQVRLEPRPKSTLQFTDACIRDVLPVLASRSGLNVVLTPDLAGDVTLDLAGFYDEALAAIAYADGVRLTYQGPTTVVVGNPGTKYVEESRRTLPFPAAGSEGRLEAVKRRVLVLGIVKDAAAGDLAFVHLEGAGLAANRSRVYLPGDALRDAEDRVIPGLQLLRVEEGVVHFEVDRQPFTVELKSPVEAVPEPSPTPSPEDGAGLRRAVEAPRLAQRIDAVLGELETALKDPTNADPTALASKLGELDLLTTRYEKIATDEAGRAKLAAWRKRSEGWAEIRLAFGLQIAIETGNGLLREMLAAQREERWDDVRASWADLQALTGAMAQEPREEFHRNGGALLERGQRIAQEAREAEEKAKAPAPAPR